MAKSNAMSADKMEEMEDKMRLLRLGICGIRMDASDGGGVTADDCAAVEFLAREIHEELWPNEERAA